MQSMEAWKNLATSELEEKARSARALLKEDEIESVPSKFQLTKSNIASWIIVPRRSKFNILRICIVAKSWFGIFIKTIGDMVEIVLERGFSQKVYGHLVKCE